MKNFVSCLILVLSFFVLSLGNAISVYADQQDSVSPPKKLLFVGNSFSFYNNGIHNHLGSLIRANGDWQRGQNRHKLLTYSGGHIYEQLAGITSMIKNDTRGFEALILQGHSNEAIQASKQARFAQALEQAVSVARANKIKPYLFMTWGYKGNDDMAKQVEQAYIKQAERLNTGLVPVGKAFQVAQSLHPHINLYVPDVLGADSEGRLTYRKEVKHPSVAGTYLAACVFYATLFDESPEGNPFKASLSVDDAQNLQKLSWQVVQEFKQAK